MLDVEKNMKIFPKCDELSGVLDLNKGYATNVASYGRFKLWISVTRIQKRRNLKEV